MKHLLILFSLLVCFPGGSVDTSAALTLQPQTLTVNGHTVQLQVPKGMQIDFIGSLDGPRFLTRGPDNELLIGSNGNNIYRLKWPYNSPELLVTIPGRNHSLAYRNGNIYVAETAGLHTAPYGDQNKLLQAEDFSLVTRLPSLNGGHWSRTVIVGPDQKIYIGIGISGNCSDEYLDNSYQFEDRRGGVYILEESGSPNLIPFSSGLRNPIGLVFHPDTGTLYATNAGPDNLGFELPPEVLTPLAQGSFHGMPWFQFYDGQFRNGECATSPAPRPASEATPPAVTFDARSTPEGITFVTGSTLGTSFMNNALVAIHGSWAIPSGGTSASRRPPKIVMVTFAEGQPTGTTDVVTGFQRPDGSRFARPCGVLMGPDGNLYFTSDSGEVTGLFRLMRANALSIPIRSTAPKNYLLLDKD